MSFAAEWIVDYVSRATAETHSRATIVKTISTLFAVKPNAPINADALQGRKITMYENGKINELTAETITEKEIRATDAKGNRYTLSFDPVNWEFGDYSTLLVPSADQCTKLGLVHGRSVRTSRQLFEDGCCFTAAACAFSAHVTKVAASNTAYSLSVGAFMHCKNIETVVLDTSELPAFAFLECTRLASVELRNVKSIGEKCFEWCAALQTVTWTASLTDIGVRAFGDCGNLASVSEFTAMQTIAADAFENTRVATTPCTWPQSLDVTDFVVGMAQ